MHLGECERSVKVCGFDLVNIGVFKGALDLETHALGAGAYSGNGTAFDRDSSER